MLHVPKVSTQNDVVSTSRLTSVTALLDDPNYVKALQRRAASNEHLNTWSSLSSADQGKQLIQYGAYCIQTYIADYTKLLSILRPSSPQYAETKRLQSALKPRLDEAQKHETGEMLDKLKGIGNSILGMTPFFRRPSVVFRKFTQAISDYQRTTSNLCLTVREATP